MVSPKSRIERFEAWAKVHGGAMRPGERRKIAEELLEIAGDEALLEIDVEALAKRYKQGLAGAQRILAAHKVGGELLAWQTEDLEEARKSERAPPPRSSPPPSREPESDDDDAPGPRVETWRRKRRQPGDSGPGSEAPSLRSPEDGPDSDETESEAPEEADAPETRRSEPPKRDVESVKPPEDLIVDAAAVKRRKRGNEAPLPASEDLREDLRSGNLAPVTKAEAPPPSVAYPVGAAAATKVGAWRGRVDWTPQRLAAAIGGALVVVLVVALFVVRPAFLFSDKGRPVTGVFKSTHLGLMMTFPDGWRHDEPLDIVAQSKDGAPKKTAVFFAGTSDVDFTSKLEVASIQRGGDPVTDEIARNVGGSEALVLVERRTCDALVRGSARGTKCLGFFSPKGELWEYATLEAYFPLGTSIVYVRGAVKVGPQTPDEALRKASETADDVGKRLDELDKIIASIDAIR